MILVENKPLRTGRITVCTLALCWLMAAGMATAGGSMPAATAEGGQRDLVTENPRLSLPHSGLGWNPDATAFLVGRIGTGGAFSNSNGQFGYGGAIVFSPDAGDHFLPFLRDWNTGLVLQVDYQELYTHYRIRSGDILLRRYFSRRSGPVGKGAADDTSATGQPPVRSFYAEAGIGMSEISFAEGGGRGTEMGWAPVAAVGVEWAWTRYLAEIRLQYRQYKRHGHDYINWSLRLGLGVPVPW